MNDLHRISTSARVRESVDALYREFAAPVPSVIEGCPCCIETRGVDLLLTTPLREIGGQNIWRYVSGVFYTVGSELDFRYLLPRILEISATDSSNSNDPEIVLGKLKLANWNSWTPNERNAIEEFVDAWFQHTLANDLMNAEAGWIGAEVESLLCGAARAGFQLSRWLERLQEPFAAPVLADLKEQFPTEPSGFWEDVPAGWREVSAMLNRA